MKVHVHVVVEWEDGAQLCVAAVLTKCGLWLESFKEGTPDCKRCLKLKVKRK